MIHLLDIVHTEGRTRTKTKQRFEVCTRAMEEMIKTWGWSGRCLRCLQSLVKEWNVDMADGLGEPGATPATTEPQGPSPSNSDGLLGGGSDNGLFESDEYGFQGPVWGVGPEFPLEDWFVKVAGSGVDQWWEDAAM